MALDQVAGDGAAAGTGDDQTEGGGGNADLHGVGHAVVACKLGRPRNRGAVAANQRHRAHQQARGGRQAAQASQGEAQQVLGQHQHDGENQQHHQGAATTPEVSEAGIHAHRGEEIHQQQIASPHAKTDLQAKGEMEQGDHRGHQQAATDGLGNGEFPQEGEAFVESLAKKQHQDSQGDREEGANLNLSVEKVHFGALISGRSCWGWVLMWAEYRWAQGSVRLLATGQRAMNQHKELA